MRLAVGVIAVVSAAVLAPAAFAHSSGLAVTAVCNTATGNYDVTWTVGPTDDLDKAPKITASSNAAIAGRHRADDGEQDVRAIGGRIDDLRLREHHGHVE